MQESKIQPDETYTGVMMKVYAAVQMHLIIDSWCWKSYKTLQIKYHTSWNKANDRDYKCVL